MLLGCTVAVVGRLSVRVEVWEAVCVALCVGMEAEGVGEGCPLPLRLVVGLREAEMLPEAVSVRCRE